MAILTNDDFRYIAEWARGQPTIKADLKGWSLPKTTWQAALQTVENYMVSGFSITPSTSIRAAIEAVTGATTAARAQSLFVAWVAWKLRSYLGV